MRHYFKPNKYFDSFPYWVSERQRVFWKRTQGESPPWSTDRVLNNVKFTNVYRVLDRGTQYLLKNVIYNGKDYTPRDLLFRITLYRHFNKPTTWDMLQGEFDDITADTPLSEVRKFLDSKQDVYNKAYMLSSRFAPIKYPHLAGGRKYPPYFKVFEEEIFNSDRENHILQAESMHQLYTILMEVTAFGPFTAMQLAVDLNYTPLFNFSENDFIIAGGGAKRGIRRVFDFNYVPQDYEAVIWQTMRRWHSLMKDTDFEPLSGHVPTLIDIQNCYCEVGKYLKAKFPKKDTPGEIHVSHRYSPQHTNSLLPAAKSIKYTFPPKWNLNLDEKCTPLKT